MNTAVDDIHAGDRQKICPHPTEITVKRHPGNFGGQSCDSQRDTQYCICPQTGFVFCAIQCYQAGIDIFAGAHHTRAGHHLFQCSLWTASKTPLPPKRFESPSRCSMASREPVLAPEGTDARDNVACGSDFHFNGDCRESRISLAKIRSIS
jgi:hypothetical protein